MEDILERRLTKNKLDLQKNKLNQYYTEKWTNKVDFP